MAAGHNKAVSLILLLHACAMLRQLKYTSLIPTRRSLSEWASHQCRRLFRRSRTRSLQQLEHGLGDCRFGQSNSNRAPPNESRCRFKPLRLAFPFAYEKGKTSNAEYPIKRQSAGEGNRTPVCSLGSCRSTIELHPRLGVK